MRCREDLGRLSGEPAVRRSRHDRAFAGLTVHFLLYGAGRDRRWIPTTATRRSATMMHAHDSNADSDDDAKHATSREQPTARSGPTSPGTADDTRHSATRP